MDWINEPVKKNYCDNTQKFGLTLMEKTDGFVAGSIGLKNIVFRFVLKKLVGSSKIFPYFN